jgi:hypothetical protein
MGGYGVNFTFDYNKVCCDEQKVEQYFCRAIMWNMKTWVTAELYNVPSLRLFCDILLYESAIERGIGPNISLSTLFSNTPSLCSSHNMTDRVSHPGKVTIVYVLILIFFDSKREERRLRTEW